MWRYGIDLGGTKIEIAALGRDGHEALRRRVPTPTGYTAIITAIAAQIAAADQTLGPGTVGIGIPGTISPATGLVKNANSTALNGHPLDRDLEAAIGRPVRVENDANCFALSEAVDGAAANAETVFGVILGTGCGGGVVVHRRVLRGRHSITGEWGHNPLPWPQPDETPGLPCWCGQRGCLETLLAGPSLARDAAAPDVPTLLARAKSGDAHAQAALTRHTDRLARALAAVVNILDPDAIVLGGGLSNLDHLYTDLPRLLPRHVFSDTCTTPIFRNRHGDSSGVRGAAWLWPDDT